MQKSIFCVSLGDWICFSILSRDFDLSCPHQIYFPHSYWHFLSFWFAFPSPSHPYPPATPTFPHFLKGGVRNRPLMWTVSAPYIPKWKALFFHLSPTLRPLAKPKDPQRVIVRRVTSHWRRNVRPIRASGNSPLQQKQQQQWRQPATTATPLRAI